LKKFENLEIWKDATKLRKNKNPLHIDTFRTQQVKGLGLKIPFSIFPFDYLANSKVEK